MSLIWPEVQKSSYPQIFLQVYFSSSQEGKKRRSTDDVARGGMSHS